MTTEIEKAKTFEQRVGDRVRESIGELMTDDDLKALIERGVDAFLFEPRREEGTYGTMPPLMQALLEQNLRGRMEQAVNKWLCDNPEVIESAVREMLAKKAGELLLETLNSALQGTIDNYGQTLIEQFGGERR